MNQKRVPEQVLEDDQALGRAAEVAGGLVLARFHALMEGRETTGAPVAAALLGGPEFPRPGEVVQQYRIVRELGAGGMGTVFLAERADGQFQRQVAIKFLRGMPTADAVRRLRGEREVLAGLDHPNIARLLDGGEAANGQPFLVLEYVEGESLHEAVASRQLDLAARVALVEQIAEAVAHAHQRLIVHRDLKPSNVLVTREGVPRLLDFGVARLLTEFGNEKSTRVFSPGYASPEQQAGGRITTRTDVYSLGVMLHELVAGTAPDGKPVEPPLPKVTVDLDLRGIARKAASEDPDDRYPSPEAFVDDLRRWREGLPVRARPDTALYRLGRFVRRHRRALAATAMVVGVIVSLGVRLVLETRRARAAEAASEVERANAQQEAARARRLLEFLDRTFEAASPDNSRGRPISASELITDARKRLDDPATTDDRPEILTLLASLSVRLGEGKRALAFADEALEAVPPAVDRSSAKRAASVLELRSQVLGLVGFPPRSLADAQRAGDLLRTFAPDAAPARDEADYYLGLALASNLDTSAIPSLERVADGKSSVDGLEFRAEAANQRAVLAVRVHEPQQALTWAKRFRQLAGTEGEDTPTRVNALYVEAGALLEAGRPGEALAPMQEAIARYEKMYPGGDKGGGLYGSLANVYFSLGQYRESAAANSRSLERRRAAGETGERLLVTEANQATLLETIGDYAGAVAMLREVVKRATVSSQISRERFEAVLARALVNEGRYDEARAILLRLRQAARAAGRKEESEIGVRLARAALFAGRAKEARAEADAVAEEFLADTPTRKWQFRCLEASIRVLEGRKAEALALHRELEREGVALSGAAPLDVARERLAIAELSDEVEARPLLAQALPVFRLAVLAQERDRVRAEALAKRLGVR